MSATRRGSAHAEEAPSCPKAAHDPLPARTQTDRIQTDQIQTDRIQTDRTQTDRIQTDRIQTDMYLKRALKAL